MPAWFLMSQREGVLCLSVEKVRGERWLTYCNISLASALNPISSCKMLLGAHSTETMLETIGLGDT